MSTGRQIYLHILQHYKVADADDEIHDFERFSGLRMKDDDIQRFISDWDTLLL